MLNKPIKRIFLFLSFFSLSFLLTTCGLEESYYLPQVPEININIQFNTSAVITLPRLDPTEFYYAQNYKIFYRIYMSDYITSSNDTSLYSNINSTLSSDYINIYPNTDPTSTTAGIAANVLFTSRNYYELELYQEDINNILTTNGGTLRILFPPSRGDYPVLSLNNNPEIRLYRSSYFFPVNPNDDKRFFRNTQEINVPDYGDLVSRSGPSQSAYVSMYVVASGINPTGFTPIYSKPTHICVFKLPDN